MDVMKICNKFDNEKELSELNFKKDTQKIRSDCIQCCSIKHKKWRDNIPEEVKQNRKNIMNKTKNKETYISKTNQKRI